MLKPSISPFNRNNKLIPISQKRELRFREIELTKAVVTAGNI